MSTDARHAQIGALRGEMRGVGSLRVASDHLPELTGNVQGGPCFGRKGTFVPFPPWSGQFGQLPHLGGKGANHGKPGQAGA